MDENVSRYLARIGSRGGKKRTKTTSAARRREIAKLAAAARWGRARKAGIASGKARSEKARRKG